VSPEMLTERRGCWGRGSEPPTIQRSESDVVPNYAVWGIAPAVSQYSTVVLTVVRVMIAMYRK